MIRISHLRNWTRLSLLFAALLYGAAAAVDPWLHADEVATAAVHADTEGSDQPGSLAGGDFHCIICQTLGTTTQPSLSATPPQAMIWLDRPVRQNWTIPSTLAFIRAQPRGPPLS
jgi:hypothetical protein